MLRSAAAGSGDRKHRFWLETHRPGCHSPCTLCLGTEMSQCGSRLSGALGFVHAPIFCFQDRLLTELALWMLPSLSCVAGMTAAHLMMGLNWRRAIEINDQRHEKEEQNVQGLLCLE